MCSMKPQWLYLLCPNCPNILPCVDSSICQALKRKEHFSLIASEGRRKNESTRPRPQSVGSVLLLQHKSQVLLHNKSEGGKNRGRGEKGAIPLICTLRAFQGKAVGPACFIANASVTSKGHLKDFNHWICTALAHFTPRGRPQKQEGEPPRECC